MKRSQEYIDVRGDGRVMLYQRPGMKNPRWQARLKIPRAKGYKIVSTGTTKLHEAQQYALDLYDDLCIKVRNGGTLRSPSFSELFKEWKAASSLGTTRYGGTWSSTAQRIESYALGYFGDTPVDAISASSIADYWHWRSVNFIRKKPSATTLRREKTCLAAVLNFGKRRGYLASTPDFEVPRSRQGRRATFTESEWIRFSEASYNWMNEGRGKSTYRDRILAHNYFQILANTGMRIGELRNLRWSDLRTIPVDDETRLVASVDGKTGFREVVFQAGSEKFVRELYDLVQSELGSHPQPGARVISHPNGQVVESLRRSFGAILRHAGLSKSRAGSARTIYSLRHYYATRRLEEGASWFLLSKQMGTSVDMLHRHYEHLVVNEKTARHLSRSAGGSYPKTTGSYPFE